MADSRRDPWLEISFPGEPSTPVDVRAVGRMLVDLTAAARQVAADILGLGDPHGPMTSQERALAGLTLTRIGPGSRLKIEIAPPPPESALSVSFDDSFEELPTADLVIRQLESDLTNRGNGTAAYRPARREAVRELNLSMRRIGPSAFMGRRDQGLFKITPIPLEASFARDEESIQERKVYFGRATMADSEPHRRRLRANLYNGQRFVLEVPDEFPTPLHSIFERDVEFRVLDEISGGVVVRSVVDAVRLLEPAEIGIDFPPKDWRRLADEQGINLSSPPDYPSMLRRLFDSEEDVEAFQRHMADSRGGSDFDE